MSNQSQPFHAATHTDPGVLDLSGYGFSGKHAYSDLIREFSGYHVEHFTFEFNLLRMPGGILDLESAVTGSWSFVRADGAMRRFKRVVDRFAHKASIRNPKSWFLAAGWNWNAHYGGAFSKLSEAYINSLIEDSWTTDWPFALADMGPIELFVRRLANKVGLRSAADVRLYLVRPERFVEATREYLHTLLTSNADSATRVLVLHNGFEPYHPENCFRFFRNAKSIVIDRDARDIFAQHSRTPHRPMQSSVDTFIKRFRAHRELSAAPASRATGVLRVWFEDLVLNYEQTVSRVLEHLGEDDAVHVRKGMYFRPEISKKNIGIWREHPRQREIARIASELSTYCRDSS